MNLSAALPTALIIFIGEVNIAPASLPIPENIPLNIFFNGLTITFFNASPNGFVTWSLNDWITGSVTFVNDSIIAFLASSTKNFPACLIGSNAIIIGSNTLPFKKP